MKMFCRDCGKNVEVRIEDLDTNFKQETHFHCSECGNRLLIKYDGDVYQ